VTWIVAELRDAFPDEPWELPQPAMRPAAVPDTLDELLLRMPGPTCNDAPELDAEVGVVPCSRAQEASARPDRRRR
jgi:hypothetical protein